MAANNTNLKSPKAEPHFRTGSTDAISNLVEGLFEQHKHAINHGLQEIDEEWQSLHDDRSNGFIDLERMRSALKQDKISIFDVLNRDIKNKHASRCVNQCIQLVLNTWSSDLLKWKEAPDLYNLLQTKKLRITIGADMIAHFYDKPAVICFEMMRIAKEIVECSPSQSILPIIHYPLHF